MSGADASQEAMNPARWRPTIPAEADTRAAGDAWLQVIRTRLDGPGHKVASGIWRQLSPAARQLLLTMCTDRKNTEQDQYAAWGSFTPDERASIGAFARQLARELKGAAWLR